MGRVMSIWLPYLPLDRRRRLGDLRLDGPFGIVSEQRNALRLTHLSAQATKAGLVPAMSIPDARAICPDLLTEKADPVREEILLKAIRRWTDRFSPVVALDKPDGLFLDITGCSHLFGGEIEMGHTVVQKLSDMQISARIGIADTKLAARALADFLEAPVEGRMKRRNRQFSDTPRGHKNKQKPEFLDTPIGLAKTGLTKATLAGFPIESLRLSHRVKTDLRRSGFTTIDTLLKHKSSELARRFGLDVTKTLNKTLGYIPDPVCCRAIDPTYSARMTLPDPIGLKDDIEAVLQKLIISVSSRLKTQQIGARNFKLTVRCVDTGDHDLSVGFARPTFQPNAIKQQFSHPLDSLRMEFGADWFRLVATNLEPLHPKQMSLEQKEGHAQEDHEKLLSTIGNRLGFDRVRRFLPENSHVPELECRSVEATGQKPSQKWPQMPCKRPERIFHPTERINILRAGRPPQAFQWRRVIYQCHSVLGPERITPDWWRVNDTRTRDYWTVQTECGSRFWLLTYPGQKPAEWFLAGRFL